VQTFKKALLDLVLLGLLSIAVGFGTNTVRIRGAIKPNKNYFEKMAQLPAAAVKKVAPPPPAIESRSSAATTANPKLPAVTNPPVDDAEPTKHLEHDYQEIKFPDLVKVFNDPGTAQGLNLIVDARKPDLYEEGHIPGAVRSYPYESDGTIDDVVARTSGVERVIVYCGGGDCEDSIFMCRELVDAGVPYESIYLYPGGWKEWSAKQMPIETGSEEQ